MPGIPPAACAPVNARGSFLRPPCRIERSDPIDCLLGSSDALSARSSKEVRMEYKRLGHWGLNVSRLCLGTMVFGRWGNTDHDECVRIMHRAFDEGINFVDTANRYAFGESEEIVGKGLRGRRNDVVLATKFFMPGPAGVLDRGTSRRHLFLQVEESLRRLGTDWIDLYQLHRNDRETPIEETLSALTDLVRQGKVRYIGVSTGHAADPVDLQWTGWRMVESLWISERRSFERFISTQPPYSIFSRDVEREVFPVCERFGFGAVVWSPLEGGWLGGRYRRGMAVPKDSRAANETEFGMFVRDLFDLSSARGQRRLDVVEELVGMAEQVGAALADYATAWVLRHPAVTSAIIGPRVMRHLDGALAAFKVKIPDEHLARIDQLVAPGTRA
jgi:aryl-alcohol dehydrogenase-like predicted oxidoreductase